MRRNTARLRPPLVLFCMTTWLCPPSSSYQCSRPKPHFAPVTSLSGSPTVSADAQPRREANVADSTIFVSPGRTPFNLVNLHYYCRLASGSSSSAAAKPNCTALAHPVIASPATLVAKRSYSWNIRADACPAAVFQHNYVVTRVLHKHLGYAGRDWLGCITLPRVFANAWKLRPAAAFLSVNLRSVRSALKRSAPSAPPLLQFRSWFCSSATSSSSRTYFRTRLVPNPRAAPPPPAVSRASFRITPPTCSMLTGEFDRVPCRFSVGTRRSPRYIASIPTSFRSTHRRLYRQQGRRYLSAGCDCFGPVVNYRDHFVTFPLPSGPHLW